MSAFTDVINAAKNAETLHDKSQLLTYLGRALSSSFRSRRIISRVRRCLPLSL